MGTFLSVEAPETAARDRVGRPAWHALQPDEALARLESAAGGLSPDEAQRRLREIGPNLLQAIRPVPAWRILGDQLRSVVVGLLLFAVAIALLMGHGLEAAAIGIVLLLNTGIGFATELHARRAMEALLALDVPRATVVRAGKPEEINASEIVPGDVIQVAEGDSIPADARLLSEAELRTSEAALTGESLPVIKRADLSLPADEPLPERRTMVYKATAATSGTARAVVVSTGMDTEVGRIGRLVSGIPDEKTPLERRLDILGRRLVWITLAVAAVIAGFGWLQGMPLGAMIETGIALAIAAVPEGLPAVATITLAIGLRRMARRSALVRRLPAVEALGSATVVCADKTGTLTGGHMVVTRLWLPDRWIEVSGAGYEPEGEFRRDGQTVDPHEEPRLLRALEAGALANQATLDRENGGWRIGGDPTDAALLVAASKAGLERQALLRRWPREQELPFRSERRLAASFHRTDRGLIALVKGAPERLVELSARVWEEGGEMPFGAAARALAVQRNEEMAAAGLRVLGLAFKEVGAPVESELEDLTFVGLVGIIDPPAPGVYETIAAFRGAGIRTVMLTGDQQPTAEAVARQLGVLGPGERTLDARALAAVPPAELADQLAGVATFSRIDPQDKLDIVSSLQARGEIVAMLGDGVNDAAALKKANVGVAMGRRGADVARDAADVILQDDRFPTLSAAVEEGRVIFDNIRKFVFYLFSCNFAEVLVLLVASVVGMPLPLLPLQILWLNLVTDTFPALALGFEPAEEGVMSRPPRDPGAAVLSAPFLRAIAFYAGLITAVTLAAYAWGLRSGGDHEAARTLAFMTLAMAQILHLGNARSPAAVIEPGRAFSNRVALGAVVLAASLQLLAVYYAPLASVLRVSPPPPSAWAVVLGLAAIPAVTGQGLRWARAFARRGARTP